MKFGKQLRGIVEYSNPEWQPNFLSYKELKKHIVPRDGYSESTRADEGDVNMTAAGSFSQADAATAPAPGDLKDSANFLSCLQTELDKVNDFFLEKQEDYVIEHRELTGRVRRLLVSGASTRIEVNRLRQRLIDFHAQLVVLENYSTVNYTGFRKILKKHDKKTGLSVQTTALRNLSTTPFFASGVTRRMLLTTERQIAELDQINKFRRCGSATDLPELPLHPTPFAVPALGLMTVASLEMGRVNTGISGPEEGASGSASGASSSQVEHSTSQPMVIESGSTDIERTQQRSPLFDGAHKRVTSYQGEKCGSVSE